jgi:hypothetical protein
MSNRRRLSMGALTAALVCASGGAALAASSGYSITKIRTPKSVKEAPLGSPKSFGIKVKGAAKAKSGLWVYLDHRKCQVSESKERRQDGVFRPGYSYFTGPSNVAEFLVKGSFTKRFSAHPGSKVGRRYVCAYLTTPGVKASTKAFKSATYQVTK